MRVPGGMGVRLLFELSGEHPTLPLAEIECVGRVVSHAPQVAIAECPGALQTGRLALTHHVMEYLGDCAPTRDGVASLLRELREEAPGTFVVRVKKATGAGAALSQLELERLIGAGIAGRVDPERPGTTYRGLVSAGRLFLGRVILSIDRGAFGFRNPLRRPFFHPGVMLPIYARAMVNLSLVQEGELLLDPFCGTGGILLEARMIGAKVLGGDADPRMVKGSRENLGDGADLLRLDASLLPIREASVDAVVTDLPYGQSVAVHGTLDSLYAGVLREIGRVLRYGKRAVIVTHRDIRHLVPECLRLLQFHEQRIHRSLTRRIMVLERL